MICPRCSDLIIDVVEHCIKCDVNVDRLVAVGLVTDEEQNTNRSKMKEFQRKRSTVVSIDGIAYDSISQAARAIGRSITHVRTLIKNGKALVIKPSEV